MAQLLLPLCFNFLEENEKFIRGKVSTEDDLKEVLEAFEACGASFPQWSRRKQNVEKCRLMWTAEIDSVYLYPCMTESRYIRRCSFAGQPHKTNNSIRKSVTVTENENVDHDYSHTKDFLVHTSRKVGCDAKLLIKTLILYEEYRVPRLANRFLKENQLADLRSSIEKGTAKSSRRIFLDLPKNNAHTNHVVSIESVFPRRIHPKMKEKIYELVGMGVTAVPVIRKMLEEFVERDLCAKSIVKPLAHDRAYFPTTKVIRKHVHAALEAGQYTQHDEDNLEIQNQNMEQENSGHNQFFLRISGESEVDNKNRSKANRVTNVFLSHLKEEEQTDEEDDDDEKTDGEDPVPEAITADTSTDDSYLFRVQCKFRETLKELADLSYLCTDIETLRSAERGLRAVYDKLRRHVQNESGLPVHQDSTVCRTLPVCKKRKRDAAKKSKTRRMAGNKASVAHVQAVKHHQDTLYTADVCKEPAVQKRKQAADNSILTRLANAGDSDATKQQNKKSHKTTVADVRGIKILPGQKATSDLECQIVPLYIWSAE